MSLPLGSASGIERMLACPASVVLPQVHSTTGDASDGTVKHAFVSDVLSGASVADALARVPADLRPTCEKVDWHALGGDLHDVRSEVAYVLDVRNRTAREVGVNIGRSYPELGEWEIPGTADIEGVRFDGVPVVDDLKSGWGEVTRSEDNGQLGFFAAVKLITTGASEVEVRIAKLRDDGSVTPDSATLSAFEVESFIDELDAGAERVHAARRVYLAGGPLDVTEGPWCRYCDSKTWCPAYTRMALAMTQNVDELAKMVAHLDEDGATKALRDWRYIGEIHEMIGKALKARARAQGIGIDERKWYAEVMTSRKSFDADAALALLRSYGASDSQIGGLYKESTFGVVREVLRPGAPRLPGRKKSKEAGQ